MDDNERLNYLPERSRIAYTLKESGLSTTKIASEMGITPNGVRELLRRAERRLSEYDRYHKVNERDAEEVNVCLTRGEVGAIYRAILEYHRFLDNQICHNHKSDWSSRLPYEHTRLVSACEKMQEIIYGRVVVDIRPPEPHEV